MPISAIPAGQLNRVITIQQQSSTRDSVGQQIQTWSDVLTTRANIDIVRSQLVYSTAEFIAKVTYKFTIRFNPTVLIEPNMRIIYVKPFTGRTSTYEIQTIVDDHEASRQLIILAYELNGTN